VHVRGCLELSEVQSLVEDLDLDDGEVAALYEEVGAKKACLRSVFVGRRASMTRYRACVELGSFSGSERLSHSCLRSVGGRRVASFTAT
jgi:hypothetical protein